MRSGHSALHLAELRPVPVLLVKEVVVSRRVSSLRELLLLSADAVERGSVVVAERRRQLPQPAERLPSVESRIRSDLSSRRVQAARAQSRIRLQAALRLCPTGVCVELVLSARVACLEGVGLQPRDVGLRVPDVLTENLRVAGGAELPRPYEVRLDPGYDVLL